MTSLRLSLKRSLLLSLLLALCIFSTAAVAQSDTTTDTTATTSTSTDDTTSTTATSSTSSTATSSTTESSSATTTTTSSTTTATSTTAASSTTSLPAISSSGSASISSMPALTSGTTSIPSYPPPSVPPTKYAPYMNRSKAPDGTVFIAVGAILGAFGAGVLIWRGVVVCMLHRSVRRAAMAQHAANDKAAFPAPPASFYQYTDLGDSTPSLATGATPGRGQRRTTRGPIPSSTPSQTNLFFSPTASAGVGGSNGAGNRESRFLPSGFYAATSASEPRQSYGTSIGLSNLRPASRGYVGPSPPDSPSLAARGTPSSRNFSTSSFNVSHLPGERAPSAYLDDLLDDNPAAFPFSDQRPSSHNRNHSPSASGLR